MKENALGIVLKYVPKNTLSYLIGKLVHMPLPRPLRRLALGWFAHRYRLNLDEAELPITSYNSIGALFTRRLKPGLRPVGGDIVHPCDAVITQAGYIEKGTLIQAKGKDYHVGDFLAFDKAEQIFEGGRFLTYYLCPTDYHRVHAPIAGELTHVTYVPGYLWPVNPWSVNAIDRLFAINERVVLWFNTSRGRVAVVMVGATNVGKMTLSFDPHVVSNAALWGLRREDKEYQPPLSFFPGQELGIFNMGSTVIVVYENTVLDPQFVPLAGKVKMGQPIMSVEPT